MSEFAYKAVQLDGKVRSGQMTAVSEAEVFAKLRAENLSPVSIVVKHGAAQGGGRLRLPGWLARKAGLSGQELEELLRNLAVLLRAGADIRKVQVFPKSGGTPLTTTLTYVTETPAYTADPNICSTLVYCDKPLTVTDPDGVTTTYTYDAVHGGVLTETRPVANNALPGQPANNVAPVTRYTYAKITPKVKNSSGTLVSTTPVWRLIEISSCMKGATCAGTTDEVRTIIDYGTVSAGVVANPIWNNALPKSTTVRRGDGTLSQETLYGYDTNGQLIWEDGPQSGTVDRVYSFYDLQGRKYGAIGADPDGSAVTRDRAAVKTIFNADGQVVEELRGTAISVTENDLNGMVVLERHTNEFNTVTGLPVRAKYFAGTSSTPSNVTERSYDSMLRLECEAQRLNPDLFVNMAAPNLSPDACAKSVPAGPDGNDRITKYTYEIDGAVKTVTTGYGALTARDEVTTTYNTNGTVNYVTDGKGNRTTYSYDMFNRLTKTCYPQAANGAASSTTDCEQQGYAGGRVSSVTLRDNQVVNFGYDALGRVSTKSGAVVESFAYDNFNQVIYHSNSTTGGAVAASTYTYNSLGWLLSDQQPLGTVSYEYDALGRRTKMTYPGSGLYVSYVYTELSELSRICENVSSTDCSTAATPLIRFAYDSYGRRSNLYRANGQTTTYSYDTASRLLDITTPSNTLTYTYTVADQVKSRANSVTSFDLLAPATGTTNYTPNGLNQIASVGSSPLTHDVRGNMTGDGGGSYAYNANNLMTSASLSSQPVSLAYDAENRLARIERSGFTTTRFLYDGADVIAEYNDAGTAVLRRYVHGPSDDEPLVWYEGATTAVKYFLHADQLGSITQLSNADGTSNTIYAYDDYGVRSTKSGSLNSRYAYTGQMNLPEIGMYYYKARMYNPVLGRFMQTDPIGYGDGMNWYAYVRNDPVNRTDPSGLQEVPSPVVINGSTSDYWAAKDASISAAQDTVRNWQQSDRDEGQCVGFLMRSCMLPSGSLTETPAQPAGPSEGMTCPAVRFKITGIGPDQAVGKSSFTDTDRRSLPAGSLAINPENFGVSWPGIGVTSSFKSTLASITFEVDWSTATNTIGGAVSGAPSGLNHTGAYSAVGNMDRRARLIGDNHIDIYDYSSLSAAQASTRYAMVTTHLPKNSIGLTCPR